MKLKVEELRVNEMVWTVLLIRCAVIIKGYRPFMGVRIKCRSLLRIVCVD